MLIFLSAVKTEGPFFTKEGQKNNAFQPRTMTITVAGGLQ